MELAITRSALETNKPSPTNASANAKIGIATIANSIFPRSQFNKSFSIGTPATEIRPKK